VSITRELQRFIVPALLLSASERPVVVTVSDDGFHWTDAGLGAAAAFAAVLLALGLVLALRPHRIRAQEGGRERDP
jgi:hypothetical protein